MDLLTADSIQEPVVSSSQSLEEILFTRISKLDGLHEELKKIILLDSKKRRKWLVQYNQLVVEMLSQIRDESRLIVMNYPVKDREISFLKEYFLKVQQVFMLLDRIMNQNNQRGDN